MIHARVLLFALLLLAFNSLLISILFSGNQNLTIPQQYINNCKEWEQKYILKTSLCPTNFETQMNLLKNEMGVPQDHKFKFMMRTMMPIGSSWNIVLQNVLLTNPKHFFVTGNEEIDTDIYIKISCYPEVDRPKAFIQNGFKVEPDAFKLSLNDQEQPGLLLSVRKVDTVVMCRLMNIRANTMKCPKSYIVTQNFNEIKEFESDATKMNERWIWKPDSGTQGADMIISSNITELVSTATENIDKSSKFVNSNGKGGIIQNLLPNPLLVEGKRFSIRMHAVVTSLNPFKGFLSAHSFVVLAAGADNEESENDASIITNAHYNVGLVNGFSQRTLMEYFQQNGLLGEWMNKTIPAMGEGFQEFLSKESIESRAPVHRFELYGCDILLDEYMNPWLLECNRCAGVRKFLKNRITLYEELIYILLYSRFVGHNVPNLNYWESFVPYQK